MSILVAGPLTSPRGSFMLLCCPSNTFVCATFNKSLGNIFIDEWVASYLNSAIQDHSILCTTTTKQSLLGIAVCEESSRVEQERDDRYSSC
jgi:hypothetical protein